jgi:hypothetical protein
MEFVSGLLIKKKIINQQMNILLENSGLQTCNVALLGKLFQTFLQTAGTAHPNYVTSHSKRPES